MPLQLIYTSAPRGVVAGRSGYCTVARSATLREAVMLQLEKWSHYQHLSLSGGQERPIHCCRIIDVRGTRYHVLSRIQDAGLDFTGRTNFVAHHLVFTPEEVREFPSPAVILRDWTGWAKSWSQEPLILDTEDWSSLKALHKIGLLPAARWQQLTGDSANGYGLLDYRSGIVFCVDGVSGEEVLGLIGESLELLELRDPSHDFRATRWEYTFTTSLQEQDTTADFRWRCFHSDNPASARFTGLDRRSLIEIRPIQVTEAEALLARLGRQPPRFIEQPKKTQCFAAETANFKAVAEGVPIPTYQWFSVDRNNNRIEIPGAIESELLIPSAPLGVSRYVVRISNSAGEETSEVAQLSCERRPVAPAQPGHERPVQVVRDSIAPREGATHRGIEESNHIQPSAPTRKADEIARNRSRVESQIQEEKGTKKYLKSIIGVIIILLGIAIGWIIFIDNKWSPIEVRGQLVTSYADASGNGLIKQYSEIKKEGEEFKVKEGGRIIFQVSFEQEVVRSIYTYKWYRGTNKLESNDHTFEVEKALEANSGDYRVFIIKGNKTKEIKFKITVQPEGSLENQKIENSVGGINNPTGSLSQPEIEEDGGIKIEGWEHTKTEAAIKGVIRQNGDAGNWVISNYKAAGHKDGEWVLMFKKDGIDKSRTNIFFVQFEDKGFNESEVGLIFSKGAQYHFFGFRGTNFVYLDGNSIRSQLMKVPSGRTNIDLSFHVELMGDGNNVKITWASTHLKNSASFFRFLPLDYDNQNWKIGYAFATGKSPAETVAPSVFFKTSF